VLHGLHVIVLHLLLPDALRNLRLHLRDANRDGLKVSGQ
jgi:hypothetical protein